MSRDLSSKLGTSFSCGLDIVFVAVHDIEGSFTRLFRWCARSASLEGCTTELADEGLEELFFIFSVVNGGDTDE